MAAAVAVVTEMVESGEETGVRRQGTGRQELRLGARGHQELVHRVAEGFRADVGHAFDEDLVELALKNVFAHAAVKESRLFRPWPASA